MNLPFLYRMLVYKLGYKIDSGLMKMVGGGNCGQDVKTLNEFLTNDECDEVIAPIHRISLFKKQKKNKKKQQQPNSFDLIIASPSLSQRSNFLVWSATIMKFPIHE